MIVKALAILLLACLLTIGVQTWRVSHYKGWADKWHEAAHVFADANQANLATIAKLQAANKQWADTNAANLANAKVYTDAAMAYAKKQQARADEATAKLRAIYAQQPDAKDWGNMALPVSVSRVADSMREPAGDQN